MNKIFKYSLALMVGAFGFASCSDSDDSYENGTWDANDGYANIFFETTSNTIELDPAEPTEFTTQLSRRNTEGAATVKFDITSNTDDVFTVSDAVFAAGESTADVTISFPKAETGKPYTLTITSTDPAFVSPKYSKGVIYTLNVTRVKWNDVGFYYDENGNKVEGWAMYTDDLFTTFFGVDNVTFPTRLQERDDKPGYFRMVNTYHENYPYNDPGDWDDSQDYYIYIDATDPEAVYIPERCNTGVDWTYGWFTVYSMVGLGIERGNQDYIDGNYGTYANGKITFPVNALLAGMSEYNDFGMYDANTNGAFSLVINPDLDLYTASLKNNDFKWEKVFTGTFMSAQLGKNTPQTTLYKGVAKADVEAENEGCYDRFAELYGTPYMIESPYADGYNLVFCVKDGKVIIPEGFESQALGFSGVGYNISGVINAANSTFSDDKVELEINFKDATGKVDMGTNVETLLNITFTMDMVLGDFNYMAVVDGEQYDMGTFSIVEDASTANGIALKDFYLPGSEVYGEADLDAGKVFVGDLQYIGTEEDEGTPYDVYTYNLGKDDRGAAFDINIDGSLSSTELILVATPDGQNMYYWLNASATSFVPAAASAPAKRGAKAGVKSGKKGAKVNARLTAKQRAALRTFHRK